jgi:hypothetical protein
LKIRPLHFIIFWTILNLLQAAFTELTSDEGYYWFYSTSLEWGYYDHPPFLAWMVKAGYSIFQNELGVRLLNVLMNGTTLFLFFKLLSKEIKEEKSIYFLLLAAPLLNYIAFIIFPDGPLLFFSLVFLTAYKKFLQKNDFISSLLMGVSVAGMLYSKYQGILIVVFTLLSNLKLLRSKYFYLSGFIALLLFIPHLYWQYEHEYITLKYHLSGRVSGFSPKHVMEYLTQQVVAIGPSLIFIPFVYKTTDPFEKTLKYIIVGTFLFFLFISFKAFVHFHWTSIAIFPLLFLAAKYYSHPGRKKWLLWLTIPFIIFLAVFRLQLMVQVFPLNHLNVDYYHGRKAWAKEIAAIAGEKPVVFINDFREPPFYSFYSGKMGVAVFSGEKRKTQYDVWNYEDSLQQKDVLLIQTSGFEGADELTTGMGRKYYTKEIRNYLSFYNVPLKIINLQRSANDSFRVLVEIINKRKQDLQFYKDEAGHYPVLYYGFLYKGDQNFVKEDSLRVMTESDRIPPGGSLHLQFMIRVPADEPRPRKISFGFQYGILPDSYNNISVLND